MQNSFLYLDKNPAEASGDIHWASNIAGVINGSSLFWHKILILIQGYWAILPVSILPSPLWM